MAHVSTAIDPRSGFCTSTSIFHSKRKPLSLPTDEFLDVATFIASRPHSPEKPAFIDAPTARQITFSHLWHNVDSVATSLSRLGVGKGDVILILSPNSIYFPVALLSIFKIGAIVTTANILNTPQEIARQIADSKPKLAFAAPPFASKLVDSNLPMVLLPGSHEEAASALLGRLRIISTIEEMMAAEPSRDLVHRRVRQRDPAAILYSSGTSGTSKGVVSTHRNLIASMEAAVSRFELQGGEHTFLLIVPMFHVYGLSHGVLSVAASGSTSVILPRFEMEGMCSAIGRYRVSYLPLVPPIMRVMCREAERIRAAYDVGSLRAVLTGGAPLRSETMEEFCGNYPTVVILQAFGMTETCGGGSCAETEEESNMYGTSGRLTAEMEAKVVDPESGKPLGVNEEGELWLRGASVMQGYYGNPEATRSALDSDGWLRTGDLCYFDEDGYMYVVDRLKELIKYKGYQVAPAELEALLIAHEEIVDAAVIPFPDKEAGELPMAYVVKKTGSNLSDSMVMSCIQQQVAPYKRIRRVEFVDAIPKNPSGKILRKNLVNHAASMLR